MAKAIIEATAYIHNPANKKTVAQILAKHLRLDKPDLIEKTYQELLMEVPRKPCPRYEGAASALKLMAQYGLNPKAAQLRPEDVIVHGFVQETRRQRLYRRDRAESVK